MIKLEKKHIKIFSILIAVIFIGSCVAIGVSQMGSTGVASAASTARLITVRRWRSLRISKSPMTRCSRRWKTPRRTSRRSRRA